MADDDFDVLPPDPLLASSEGDEAPALVEKDALKNRWLGVAAGVGVGSAAIAAAVMFWGKKTRSPVQGHRGGEKQGPRPPAKPTASSE